MFVAFRELSKNMNERKRNFYKSSTISNFSVSLLVKFEFYFDLLLINIIFFLYQVGDFVGFNKIFNQQHNILVNTLKEGAELLKNYILTCKYIIIISRQFQEIKALMNTDYESKVKSKMFINDFLVFMENTLVLKTTSQQNQSTTLYINLMYGFIEETTI
ncbi:hypothetical protein H8356DRAFT_1360686 [Neocallimastix lanati (nom. inval.)]|nr:hypothetical protein H8356DRAFT_1360686 [Neocallimastix sp. JGI-2020a]